MTESHYQDIEREHSFDGITEFDNHMPRWWLWSFYLACIFSVFYWAVFHTTGMAKLPGEAFKAEMAALAAQSTTMDDETLRALTNDAAFVKAGKEIFDVNCVACHRADGGGMPALGPNLTDGFWLHGGSPEQILATIKHGVIEKGMVAWGPVLGAKKCAQVATYILTMRNTNVANGREPQGDAYNGN